MLITWVWILGLMGLFDIPFNIVNIIISTLIFGLGDDYSLFIMDGLLKEYKTGKKNLGSYKSSIFLSAITTLAGLGVLIFAKHPALQSIALIAIIGIACVVMMSQILIPFFFHVLIKNRAAKKRFPWTFAGLFKSIFAFTYFVFGCILLTVTGILVIKLNPFNKARGKLIYHYILSKFALSLIYIMGNVKKQIFNPLKEDFKKPAVVIANHQSFLDILVMIMLHPKLILLTNKWVWKSPVFGAVVRMAEYYPVAEGAEDSLEPLQDLVNRGYSIVVFPEGTRSYSDKINRFHKGAFYISEKLKLDIVPLVLHGIHYTMQKGDWLLKDGMSNIYIYPRIPYDDEKFGATYSEKAKYIGRFMREELEKIKQKNETPSYFREQLLRTYTYKSPSLEWYCRIKTKLEDNYEPFHNLLPRKGQFYDLGCGYGFMTYMLHWAAPERKFVGVDYDAEKIETAEHNFLRDDHVYFVQADLTKYELQHCDGIIISDVLHYLLPEQQKSLLDRCYAALNDDGVLIIRDGVMEMQKRIEGTKRTEVWSTRIMKFNKTQNDLHFISKAFIESFARERNMHLEIMDFAKYTANLTFILKKQ